MRIRVANIWCHNNYVADDVFVSLVSICCIASASMWVLSSGKQVFSNNFLPKTKTYFSANKKKFSVRNVRFVSCYCWHCCLFVVCLSFCLSAIMLYCIYTAAMCIILLPKLLCRQKTLWCWLQFCVFYFVTNAISVSSSFIITIAIVTMLL